MSGFLKLKFFSCFLLHTGFLTSTVNWFVSKPMTEGAFIKWKLFNDAVRMFVTYTFQLIPHEIFQLKIVQYLTLVRFNWSRIQPVVAFLISGKLTAVNRYGKDAHRSTHHGVCMLCLVSNLQSLSPLVGSNSFSALQESKQTKEKRKKVWKKLLLERLEAKLGQLKRHQY